MPNPFPRFKIQRISAFQDNYIWCLINDRSKATIVVDPGEAAPVLKFLKESNLELKAILITHHHWDHTGGISELLSSASQNIPVFGGHQEPISGLTHPLKEGEQFQIADFPISFQVLEIPGHTLGHIAYVIEEGIFSGDTLFTGGCGKLFEGTAAQMLNSLNKIKKLPIETSIYCGHEYTLANLRFAKIVEPQNLDLEKRLQEVNILRSKNEATVPASLGMELLTNPFLRTHIDTVQKAVEQEVGTKLDSEVEIFAALRQWKNNFKA